MELKSNKISIIIPVHNGEDVIADCLNSVFSCRISVPFEVLVIDDGSSDHTADIVQSFACEYISIQKSGVARARNIGIQKAQGDILFFFDADVRLKEDTIGNFLKHFQEDTDAFVIQGRWAPGVSFPYFSSEFLLLKYHFNFEGLFQEKHRLAVSHLATGCLGMRRKVLEQCGGFDEGYKRSGGEEHELGYRLHSHYKIWYYDDIFVEHPFSNLIENFRKVNFRSTNFSMLVLNAKDKSFVKLHRTTAPQSDRLSLLLMGMILMSLLTWPVQGKLFGWILCCLLGLYVLNLRSFMRYLLSQKGFLFAFKGAGAHFFIMIPRFLGMVRAFFIFFILRKKKFKY